MSNLYFIVITWYDSLGGIFLVSIAGKEMYSKQKTGRFPEIDEIISQING